MWIHIAARRTWRDLYVKLAKVVSTRYSQVSVLRTIEEILGTEHINLNTAFQRPMSDVFDIQGPGKKWSYTAEASTVLAGTQIASAQQARPLLFARGPVVRPKHDAAYWDRVTAGFDFSEADQVPPALFNRVLWTGLKGSKPYLAQRAELLIQGTTTTNNIAADAPWYR